MRKIKDLVKVILELSKVKITIAVSITTLAGFILYNKVFDLQVLYPVSGIFLLACGASVINHLQERKTDAMMPRTKNRPLPSGKISPTGAIFIAGIEIIAGSLLLIYGAGLLSLLLGYTALIWYNIIYTNLKKVTVHAVIPGSVIGSIPPLIGWVSAGGNLIDIKALVIALFFFVWQVPHFYLLAFKYAEDYNRAGFPFLTKDYSAGDIRVMIFYWILFLSFASLLIPIVHVSQSVITFIGIILLSINLIYKFFIPLIKSTEYRPGKYFMKINYYVLSVVLLLIFDGYFK